MRLHRLVSFLALCTAFAAGAVGEAYGFAPPKPDPLQLDIAWFNGYTGHTDGAAAFVALPDVAAYPPLRYAADRGGDDGAGGRTAGEAARAVAGVAASAVAALAVSYLLPEHSGAALAALPLVGLSLDRFRPLEDKPDDSGSGPVAEIVKSIGAIEASQKEAAERQKELATEVEKGQRSHSEMKVEMDKRLNDVVTNVEAVRKVAEETQKAVAALVQDSDRPSANGVAASAAATEQDRAHLAQFARARGAMRDLPEDVQASLQVPQAMLTSDGVQSGDAFVPVTFVDQLIRRAREMNPLREHARIIPVTKGDTLVMPKQKGQRMGARWSGRRRAASDTQTDESGTVRIPTNKLDAEPKVTPEMLDDAGIDVVQYLEDELTIEFGISEGEGFVTGDGNEMPLGLLSERTLAEITKFKSGHATGVPTWKPLAKLVADLPTMYSTARARWFINKSTLYTLLTFETEEGLPLWNFRGLAEGKGPQFLGHQYVTLDAMPALNLDAGTYTTGDVPVLFGDMYEAYVIADKKGMIMRPNPFKDNAFVFFYTMKRVGGQTVQANALRALQIGA